MKIIGIIGKIGSGKSYISGMISKYNFNADKEVSKIYKKNKICFNKLKRKFPKKITKFPIDKQELQKIVNENKNNLKKLGKIVHPLIRIELKKFLKRYSDKKVVVLDIPLLIENKIKIKNLILVYVEAQTSKIIARLKKRKNFNKKTYKILKELQLSPTFKKKNCKYIIKNNFKKRFVKKQLNKLRIQLSI